jgi:uncharacterized protein (TIGR03000 family)
LHYGHYHGWPSYYYSSLYPYGYYGYRYRYYGYPYRYYGYPYRYYGYPYGYYSYPFGYYGGVVDDYYSAVQPQREYVVTRPETEIARVEVRLPDPEGKVWVQGKQMSALGTARRFRSPALDPARRYAYTITAEWYDNGQLVTAERKVHVQANSSIVVDFNRPREEVRISAQDRPAEITPPQLSLTE